MVKGVYSCLQECLSSFTTLQGIPNITGDLGATISESAPLSPTSPLFPLKAQHGSTTAHLQQHKSSINLRSISHFYCHLSIAHICNVLAYVVTNLCY
jgi:hypothetical protein